MNVNFLETNSLSKVMRFSYKKSENKIEEKVELHNIMEQLLWKNKKNVNKNHFQLFSLLNDDDEHARELFAVRSERKSL